MTQQTPHSNTNAPAAPPTKIKRIGDLLINCRLISQEQLEEALAFQKLQTEHTVLGTILVNKGYVSQEDITSTLASSLDVPFMVLTADAICPDAVDKVPWELNEKYNMLPMSIEDDCLTLAVEDFSNLFIIGEIERIAQLRVEVVAATSENISQIRDELYPDRTNQEAAAATMTEFGDVLSEISDSELTLIEQEEEVDEAGDLEAAAADSPVIKLVNYIIQNAVLARASDIHIEPEKDGWRVRYRKDGDLKEEMRPPAKLLAAVVSRIKIMATLDISERRLPQDGGIMVMVANNPIDLRVSTMPSKFGEKVVMRVIDNSGGMLQLEALGIRPKMVSQLREITSQPNGILLVTGPTGSGKSTTLYAALSEIISEKRNISTVEDPVEFTLKGINQFQINTKAGFTFPRALRALLRQDPDILMVGEIRDVETARLATEAALTGHFVFSTLHTNDAPTAIPRLINMGVEHYLVAASLRGILGQRLIKQICQHCKRPKKVDTVTRNILNHLDCDGIEIEQLYEGAGCNRCHNSGFSGRVGVYELLIVNEDLLGGLGEDLNVNAIRKIAATQGFKPMIIDGLEKVKEGAIALEGLLEAVAKSNK